MPNDSLMSLTGVVTALAKDVIRVQERLDRAAKRDEAAFAIVLAQAPEALAPLLRPLAPARLRASAHQVTTSLHLAVRHGARLELAVRPLSLAYSLSRQSTLGSDATLVVEVAQVPRPHRTTKGVSP